MGLELNLKGKDKPKSSKKSGIHFEKSNVATIMGAFMGMCVAFAFMGVISSFELGIVGTGIGVVFAVVSAIFGAYWFIQFRKA